MRGLISVILAVALASEQLPAKVLEANEELFPHDELRTEPTMPENLPGVGDLAWNSSAIQRDGTQGVKYGAHIERVDLLRCQHWKNYQPYFYGGMVVNSRSWVLYRGNKRATSIALLTEKGELISSSSGAWPTKLDQMFHTWEYLHFGETFQDIRTTNPGTLHIQSWNSGQQIYIPLYMGDMAAGRAYMLHIYPEPDFLSYPPDYSYVDGLLWARGDANRLYKFDIDLAGLIRDLNSFSSYYYKKYITAHGVVSVDPCMNQICFVYGDVRHIDVQGLTEAPATEYLCKNPVLPMDMTWAEMKAILQHEFKWL